MNRTTLLASTALFLLATPVLADGAGDKRLTGLGDVGYNFLSIDGTSNVDLDHFHGTGSALWSWSNNWNAQGNFDFNSFSDGGEGIANWKLGGAGFWRDINQGMLGGELHYQAIAGGGFADGFDIKGRGEWFLSEATIGAYIGHSSFDQLDGWQLGAYGTYYAQPNLGLRLGTSYASWDPDFSPEFNDWSLDGEVEYLIPDCTTSLYAGLGFGTLDSDVGSDADYWRFGLGLRVHFGTDGSLLKRNRTEPLRLVGSNFVF